MNISAFWGIFFLDQIILEEKSMEDGKNIWAIFWNSSKQCQNKTKQFEEIDKVSWIKKYCYYLRICIKSSKVGKN